MTNQTIPDEAVEAAWAAYCLELYPSGKDFPSAVRAALTAALPFLLAQARREGIERLTAVKVPEAFITSTSARPDYYVTIKVRDIEALHIWHSFVLDATRLNLAAFPEAIRALPGSNETKEG